ncbi:hypothetical protein FACS1894158_14670 [Betaproteobacteria bacterium]|nr:hypothetical protein FACS1894158_14670 [Betaproteobacteria bacterium]GHU20208.1 hypothetical protein FACS189475_08720 [Betaproteobacteria bacterium]
MVTLVLAKTTLYRYDTRNRLIEVSQTDGATNEASGANGIEQRLARYGYDPFNRRIWKEQYANRDGQAIPASRTYYLYSDEGLIAESTQAITLNGDGSVTANGQAEITSQYGPKPESEFTTGILFIKTKNSNNQDTFAYYHHDYLNTPVQATDKQGKVIWSANYNAFGRASITTPRATAEQPNITSNLRLPGQVEDSETGLHYNFNRYYDPEIGRYVTQDPVGIEGGINLYAYVNGGPLIYVDPTGEVGFPGAIYGGVAGGIGGYISGGWKGALYGAGAGALVGTVNPWASHWAGGAAGAGAASLLGQAAGNYVVGKSLSDPCNYDFSAAVGAAVAGSLGGPFNHAISRYGPQIRLSEIGRKVGSQSVSRLPALTLGAIAEGVVVGSGEFAAAGVGAGICGCSR